MTIERYPIVFNVPSVDLGGFLEVIRPQAVNRTLGDRTADVVALRNHDSTLVLGRQSNRTVAIEKDERGLLARIDADASVSYVADLLSLIKRGDALGGSFAFRALDDVWSLRDNVPFREVLDMSIREISFGVTFPAYAATASTRHSDRSGLSLALARCRLQQALVVG